jgi:Zn-dependent peptidase ImmA (M78 family)
MKRSRSHNPEANRLNRWFAEVNGCYSTASAIERVGEQLLGASGQVVPPVDLAKIADLRRIVQTIYEASLGTSATLETTKDGFVVALNGKAHWYFRREWWAHEIAHTFFYDPESRPPRRLFGFTPEEELLCDRIARELLIPTRFLSDAMRDQKPSIRELRRLSKLFQVSLSTMSRRLTVDLEFWNAVILICEKRLPISARTKEQSNVLRITHCVGPVRKGYFAPPDKRVEKIKVIVDAFSAEGVVEGEVQLERFGDLTGTFRAEAVALPARGNTDPRVLAVFDLSVTPLAA